MLRISIQNLLKLKLASSVLVAVLDFHDYSPKLFEKESPSRKEDAEDESLTWGFERALHVQLRLPFWLPQPRWGAWSAATARCARTPASARRMRSAAVGGGALLRAFEVVRGAYLKAFQIVCSVVQGALGGSQCI